MKPAPAAPTVRAVRRGWIWKTSALTLLILGVLVTYRERQPLLIAAGRWLNISRPLEQPVDYAVVLGGGATTRPFVAAAMVRAGFARTILLPDVDLSDEGHDGIVPSEYDIVRDALLQSGVPGEAIVRMESVVTSTEEEAKSLAAFLNHHPGARVAIVTNDYHTRRTRMLFSRACGARSADLQIIGAPTDGYDATNWWKFESGIVAYLMEYLKLCRNSIR